MFRKDRRINRRAFSSISNGKTIVSPLFSFKFVRKSEQTSRFSIVVSKKVAKTAVLRNKLKRRMYEALGKTKICCISGVFYLKKDVIYASYRAIEAEINTHLSKI